MDTSLYTICYVHFTSIKAGNWKREIVWMVWIVFRICITFSIEQMFPEWLCWAVCNDVFSVCYSSCAKHIYFCLQWEIKTSANLWSETCYWSLSLQISLGTPINLNTKREILCPFQVNEINNLNACHLRVFFNAQKHSLFLIESKTCNTNAIPLHKNAHLFI